MRNEEFHFLRIRLSSQQPQAALKQEARRDSLKLGSRRLPLKLGSEATVETKVAQRPKESQRQRPQKCKTPCRAITAQQGEGSSYVYEKITCIGYVGMAEDLRCSSPREGCVQLPVFGFPA